MQENATPPDPLSEASRDTGGGAERPGRRLSVRPGVVVAGLVAAALIAFVVQNGSEVPVKWLFIEVDGPLWAVIIVAAVAGAVLTEVLGWVVGRRRRRRRRRSK